MITDDDDAKGNEMFGSELKRRDQNTISLVV